MRRLLASIVAVTWAGCSCYDTAYDAFCADTGKCASTGRLTVAVTDVEVGTCGSGVVTFLDEAGVAARAGMSGTLQLDAGSDVELFSGSNCSEPPAPFAFTADQSTVAFRYLAGRFGAQQLTATALGRTARAQFLSTATLRFAEKRHAVLNDGGCSAPDDLTLQAFAPAVASGAPSRQAVVIRLTGGAGLNVATESGMCSTAADGYSVTLPAGDSQISLYAESSQAPGTIVGLTAVAVTPGSGLTGVATIDVHSVCYGSTTPCDAGVQCCTGSCLGTCP